MSFPNQHLAIPMGSRARVQEKESLAEAKAHFIVEGENKTKQLMENINIPMIYPMILW